MDEERKDRNLDELLSDIRRLIDDMDAPVPTPAPEQEFDLDALLDGAPLPEADPAEPLDLAGLLEEEEAPQEPQPAPQAAWWTQRQEVPEAKDPQQAYADWLYEQEQPKEFHETRWTDRQKVPKHVAKLQQNQQQAYADWLYEQERRGPQAPPVIEEPMPQKKKRRGSDETPILPKKENKPRKKGHGLRRFLIFLVVLALLVTAAAVFLLPRQPKTNQPIAARRDGVSTILLLGTDDGGARTDTLMLLTLDQPAGRASLVSIPRDTLVNGSYAVPKINSVYGANNGGAEGIDMVMTRVQQCIGFRPDGYLLFRLDTFVDFVDALGGVEFDVPTDMFYNDPSQDLYIALKQGLQTLTGEEAMGLVRFRSGYADADLGRVKVQRQFLSALMEQAVSLKGILQSPRLLQVLLSDAETDLTTGNLLWLAEAALTMELSNMDTATLPGSGLTINGGSYYVLDPAGVAQTVNAYCNPYTRDITTNDLDIRQG